MDGAFSFFRFFLIRSTSSAPTKLEEMALMARTKS